LKIHFLVLLVVFCLVFGSAVALAQAAETPPRTGKQKNDVAAPAPPAPPASPQGPSPEPVLKTSKETTEETNKKTVEKKLPKGGTKTITTEKTTKTVIDKTKETGLKGVDRAGWWVLGIVGLVLLAYAVTLSRLAGWKVPEGGPTRKWSLTAALSEEIEITTLDANGVPQKTTQPVASASRLMAFLGLIGILGMFLGTGFYTLWALFKGGRLPELEKIGRFLAVGAVIFAPYVANQLKGIFSPFKK
jgi:hypothetical protein